MKDRTRTARQEADLPAILGELVRRVNCGEAIITNFTITSSEYDGEIRIQLEMKSAIGNLNNFWKPIGEIPLYDDNWRAPGREMFKAAVKPMAPAGAAPARELIFDTDADT